MNSIQRERGGCNGVEADAIFNNNPHLFFGFPSSKPKRRINVLDRIVQFDVGLVTLKLKPSVLISIL